MTYPTLRCSLVCLASLLAMGCPGDDGSTEDGAASTSAGTAPTSGAESTATSAPGTGSGTAPATSNGDATGPGGACDGSTCTDSEYCDWNANACGEAGFTMGTCTPRPEGCGEIYEPVCGCDGEVHDNDCFAASAGVDVDAQGECTPPGGLFRCGYRFCSVATAYCQVAVSDVGGEPDGFSCIQPAAPCDPLTCDCLTEEPCFDFACNETKDGGIEIICPGG